jgi:hypothetical protein
MPKIQFTEARVLPAAGPFSFVSESGMRMTMLMPAHGQHYDERMFLGAALIQGGQDSQGYPKLTATVYL